MPSVTSCNPHTIDLLQRVHRCICTSCVAGPYQQGYQPNKSVLEYGILLGCIPIH